MRSTAPRRALERSGTCSRAPTEAANQRRAIPLPRSSTVPTSTAAVTAMSMVAWWAPTKVPTVVTSSSVDRVGDQQQSVPARPVRVDGEHLPHQYVDPARQVVVQVDGDDRVSLAERDRPVVDAIQVVLVAIALQHLRGEPCRQGVQALTLTLRWCGRVVRESVGIHILAMDLEPAEARLDGHREVQCEHVGGGGEDTVVAGFDVSQVCVAVRGGERKAQQRSGGAGGGPHGKARSDSGRTSCVSKISSTSTAPMKPDTLIR